MAEQFDGDWLDLREPFDAAARNAEIAARLATALPARPRLLDLGAGTGSLTRWLGHFIGRAQAWTLVDADAALITRAFETVADRAKAVGWRVTWPGKRTLLVHAPGGAWRVEGLVADLRDAPANLPLRAVDAVVNTALCDLVGEAWVERVAAACAAARLPFYAALNVTGRERFAPARPGDALVARGFARDQRRDKGFGGAALGPRAPRAIAAAFGRHGYTVLRGTSDAGARGGCAGSSALGARRARGCAGAAAIEGVTPMPDTPVAIVAAEVPARTGSGYPAEFRARVAAREKRALGDVFGLRNFGVNLTRLPPGAASALRHAHAVQDEFVYILAGEPTLVTDAGETTLRPGMCAGFRAGTGDAHHLINRGLDDVLYLEVGDRSPGDSAVYPDDNLAVSMGEDGKWAYSRMDGTPL